MSERTKRAIALYLKYELRSSLIIDKTARVIPQLGQGIPFKNLIGHVMSKMKNAAAKRIATAAFVI